MHILLIHQAFVPLDEAGGTRHHELALHLSRKGHRVTVIASPVSYLTGKVARGELNGRWRMGRNAGRPAVKAVVGGECEGTQGDLRS